MIWDGILPDSAIPESTWIMDPLWDMEWIDINHTENEWCTTCEALDNASDETKCCFERALCDWYDEEKK